MKNIETIKQLAKENKIIWTNHAINRMTQRNISQKDVKSILLFGEIIEEYNDDYPYPSYLIMGVNLNKSIIHVVCGINNNKELWIITAYYPNNITWEKDMKTRKEK